MNRRRGALEEGIPAAGTDPGPLAEILRRYRSGCGWSFAGKLCAILTAFALNALLARVLPMEEMGAFVLLQSLVAVVALAAQLGLPQTVVRLVAESLALGDKGRVQGVVRVAFLSSTLVALAAAGLSWLARAGEGSGALLGGRLAALWHLVALWVLALVWQGIQGASFRGFNDLRCSTLFEGVLGNALFLLLVLLAAALSLQATLPQVVLAAVLAGLTSAVFGGWALRARLSGLGRGGSAPFPWDRVLRDSLPLLLVTVCSLALSQADLWIIGAFCPARDVALYNAAVRLAQAVSIVMVVVNVAVSPLIAELNVQGRKVELEALLRKLSGIALIPALVFLVVLALWGGEILELVFGAGYRPAQSILLILSVGHLVNVWTGACGLTLVMTGEQNSLMVLTLVTSSLMVLASLFLVRSFGFEGVAVASCSGMALQNLAALVIARLRTRMWTHAKFNFKLSGR